MRYETQREILEKYERRMAVLKMLVFEMAIAVEHAAITKKVIAAEALMIYGKTISASIIGHLYEMIKTGKVNKQRHLLKFLSRVCVFNKWHTLGLEAHKTLSDLHMFIIQQF